MKKLLALLILAALLVGACFAAAETLTLEGIWGDETVCEITLKDGEKQGMTAVYQVTNVFGENTDVKVAPDEIIELIPEDQRAPDPELARIVLCVKDCYEQSGRYSNGAIARSHSFLVAAYDTVEGVILWEDKSEPSWPPGVTSYASQAAKRDFGLLQAVINYSLWDWSADIPGQQKLTEYMPLIDNCAYGGNGIELLAEDIYADLGPDAIVLLLDRIYKHRKPLDDYSCDMWEYLGSLLHDIIVELNALAPYDVIQAYYDDENTTYHMRMDMAYEFDLDYP